MFKIDLFLNFSLTFQLCYVCCCLPNTWFHEHSHHVDNFLVCRHSLVLQLRIHRLKDRDDCSFWLWKKKLYDMLFFNLMILNLWILPIHWQCCRIHNKNLINYVVITIWLELMNCTTEKYAINCELNLRNIKY